jgi:pilus assembly protein TadC
VTNLRENAARNLLLSAPPLFLFPGVLGLVLSIAIWALMHFGVPELERRRIEQIQSITPASVCELIELLALCSSAGLTALDCFRLICDCLDEPLKSAITRLLARCDLGMSLTKSLQKLATEFPELAAAVNVLIRTQNSGARTIGTLEIVLHLHRAQMQSQLLQRVRALSVKCVLPLGLCFLPAFVLLTIVPIVGCLIPTINLTSH